MVGLCATGRKEASIDPLALSRRFASCLLAVRPVCKHLWPRALLISSGKKSCVWQCLVQDQNSWLPHKREHAHLPNLTLLKSSPAQNNYLAILVAKIFWKVRETRAILAVERTAFCLTKWWFHCEDFHMNANLYSRSWFLKFSERLVPYHIDLKLDSLFLDNRKKIKKSYLAMKMAANIWSTVKSQLYVSQL